MKHLLILGIAFTVLANYSVTRAAGPDQEGPTLEFENIDHDCKNRCSIQFSRCWSKLRTLKTVKAREDAKAICDAKLESCNNNCDG